MRKIARISLLLGVAVAVIIPTALVLRSSEVAPVTRPNVLLIVTDDQRAGTMDFMPETRARIFDQGIAFDTTIATTPLCCPSRASIFTGLYAQHHGVHFNHDPLSHETLFERFDAAGYFTGIVGTKYLNSWDDRAPRLEFDSWVAGGGYSGEVPIDVNGVDTLTSTYITDAYRDHALSFFDQAAAQADPFLLLFATNAPHEPATPAPEDAERYTDLAPHRPPSFNEADVSDKPVSIGSTALLTDERIAVLDALRLQQLRSLAAVDRAVAALLDRLESQGRLDDTVVVFMSDNGYFWGEHRLGGKDLPYEEAVRVPLAIRYPPAIPSPRVEHRIVATIDIAPTLYDLAGISMPEEIDGRSLAPLFADAEVKQPWRDDILIEGWLVPFNAVRTAQYLYVETPDDTAELYDLVADPFELENQIAAPGYDAIEADLLARLDRLKPERRFEPALVDDDAPMLRYQGWRGTRDPRASGGSYRTAARAERAIRFTTPAVDEFGIVLYRGPDQGEVLIEVDGTVSRTVDLYAATAQYDAQFEFRDLPATPHKVTLTVLGTHNPLSTGTDVRFDALRLGTTRIEDDAALFIYAGWFGYEQPQAAGGTYRKTGRANATVEFRVGARSITWLTARGPSLGIANIFVNGALVGTVDLYHPTWQWQYRQVIPLGASEAHAVSIVVTGSHNPASTGAAIVFDGFTVP